MKEVRHLPDPYISHSPDVETREDGVLILGSGLQTGPVADKTGDWLHHWAVQAPDRVFLAERDGGGWRVVTYAQALDRVRRIAAALLSRGMGPDTPLVVLSGPSVNHGLLALATQYIGVPLVPLAEQYALIPEAYPRLRHAVEKTAPGMVYSEDGKAFAAALARTELAGLPQVVARDGPDGSIAFDDLLAGAPDAALDAAFAAVGPDSLAKILFTSGSTSLPKGVPQTQRMMCVNQAQLRACLPFLKAHPPVLLDWMPWNHVFGGNFVFNAILANGGSYYLDDGKPIKGRFGRTLENLGMVNATLSLNVPIAYAMLVDAMRDDAKLRAGFFDGLDMIFYAGASLPADVWAALEGMANSETGRVPMMTSSWGLTETAPMAVMHYQGGAETGHIGVPVPMVEAKLIPESPGRYEIRVRGPNVMDGYFDDAEKTKGAFDDEGFFITNDAVRFVDEADPAKGVKFDGRISEDFKLQTGTWVQAGNLRLEALAALSGLVQDVVITGADQREIGILIFPPATLGLSGKDGTIRDAHYLAQIAERLSALAANATGSASRIARALVLADPPHVGDGEITAKGSLNNAVILRRRAGLLKRLYRDDDPSVLRV
ncbi:MAG: feruloyl-CoA synthase [Paracoccaceae bacterium]|jgi:feruloyl-CoA synthase|nr:feruloyl-CoA synthase [Paracoccaceae bacterium]MDP7186519.1 feruloyl-CoA synthase [Paracoccaceae bacterium]